MTTFPRENGMSSYTAIMWLTEYRGDVKFRDGCTVTAKCPANQACVIAATAQGSPGAAFVSAVYKAAFEHDANCLAKIGAPTP